MLEHRTGIKQEAEEVDKGVWTCVCVCVLFICSLILLQISDLSVG